MGPRTPPSFDLQAHRGGRGLAPENTLAAFRNALTLGVNTLELDVGLSADGQVVISHDMQLNPAHTRDAQGRWVKAPGPSIHSLTLAQLQSYDVGRLNPATDYGRQFASQQPRDGERIPTLAQLFEQVKAMNADAVRFNIETKIDPTRPELTATPEVMVRALLAEIDRAGMATRVTIQSFDWRTLALVGQLAPRMTRTYLSSERTLQDPRWTIGLKARDYPSVPALVRAAANASVPPGSGGLVIWSPAENTLTPTLVRQAQEQQLRVLPWTVNSRELMARVFDWGVDGIITDYPDRLRALLQERGMPLPVAANASAAPATASVPTPVVAPTAAPAGTTPPNWPYSPASPFSSR